MAYKFSETEAATANNYLNPGIYRVKVKDVKEDKFQKGTPYIGITFETEEGASFTEKFAFGSEEGTAFSLKRLQYLHEGWFNKSCTRDFTTLSEITSYFKKALTGKPITKTVIVGGNDSNGTVYASLPVAGYIVPEDEDAEIGEFDTDSKEYKKYVTVSKFKSESVGKKNGILSDDEDVEIGKSKETTKSSKNESKATTSKKDTAKKPEPVEVETDEEEMPW